MATSHIACGQYCGHVLKRKYPMKVMVALEDRFFKTRNGNIYSNTTCDYTFWSRYLKVFDEVVVLARVRELDQEEMDKPPANGSGVSFIELPYYIGPLQYLKKIFKLNKTTRESVEKADFFILRIPGAISTRLWHRLRKAGKPYGVEVVGDPLDSMRTAGGNRLMRSYLSFTGSRNQKKQCQEAAAASYVSEFYLQQKYPAKCWSTHYSTLDLPDEAIINEYQLEDKIISFKDVAEKKRSLRICHAGTMEVAYKSQDVLIEALAIVRKNGLDVELSLLGEGRYSAFYCDRVRQLGIEKYVKFMGMLPAGEAVRKQLDLCDIFVLPSTTEGLPRIVIEAMARGLPCIATNIGGIPELLHQEDMVAPGDANMLAEKMMSIACDQKRLEDMSRRNWESAKRYRIEELNCRRVKYYKELIEQTVLCENIND